MRTQFMLKKTALSALLLIATNSAFAGQNVYCSGKIQSIKIDGTRAMVMFRDGKCETLGHPELNTTMRGFQLNLQDSIQSAMFALVNQAMATQKDIAVQTNDVTRNEYATMVELIAN